MNTNSHLITGIHTRGYLPHLKNKGSTYFVTFRLAGTIPASMIAKLQAKRDAIIKHACEENRIVLEKDLKRLNESFVESMERYLDKGIGQRWLAREEIAGSAAGALTHFEGCRYTLHAWVVMPNHVHAVVSPMESHSLSSILHSWKSASAVKANRILGMVGKPFWQRESFDRLIRDEREFVRFCEYTINNPVAASLCEKPEDWRYSSASKQTLIPEKIKKSRILFKIAGKDA